MDLLQNLEVSVHRAKGFDASRQLAVKGRYFEFMTWPDKWSSWILFATFKAFRLNRTKKFDMVWVTFPIASALVIAYWIARLLNKPLVVDIRDPIWEEETWTDTVRNRLLRRIERKVLSQAQRIIFTSAGTIEKYRRRYPALVEDKALLITNGFDELDFATLHPNCVKNGKKVFLHSGLLPKYERNPEAFFLAISDLKQKGIVDPLRHEFRLRACGHKKLYQQRIEELGIGDLLTFPAPIAYQHALAEMLGADALMIFQDATCNWQTPAKLFEYFRAGKPILAWSDRQSDTGKLLATHCGNYVIESLRDSVKIAHALTVFLQKNDWQGQYTDIEQYSRQALTKQLETLLCAVKVDDKT